MTRFSAFAVGPCTRPKLQGVAMAQLAGMVGISFVINSLLVVAAGDDRLWRWSGFLFGASISIGLATGGTILMLPSY